MSTQTVIALRKSGYTGNTPSTSSLSYGELAINYADGIIYYKKPDDSLGSIYNTAIPGIDKDIIFNDGGSSLGANSGLTFDKATANLYVGGLVNTNQIKLDNFAITTTGSYSTANTNQVVIDTFDRINYRTAKYSMQLSYDSRYHFEEISIIHDGTFPKIIEYGVMYTTESLGSFDVIISGSIMQLIYTPVYHPTTLKFTKTIFAV